MEKEQHQRCIGVDLDGTMAFYEEFIAPDNIGAPVAKMIQAVKQELSKGTDVVIFTARANPGQGSGKDAIDATKAIVAIATWSQKVFGQMLAVTHEKSRYFDEIWDDRGRQVWPNLGVFVTDILMAGGKKDETK